jgi:hypothetical protein
MEITIQQGHEQTATQGGVPRRNFKLKNGSYENAAYNDGGVPVHYIIVAWMQEPDIRKWDKAKKAWVDAPRPQEVQDYIDKFYPHWDENSGVIVLGETNSDETMCKLSGTAREDEDQFIYLQEMAIKLAEEKGLIPKYTVLDIAECSHPSITLYGE